MEHRPVRAGASDVARVHSDHAIADVLIVDDHPLMCDALSATLGYAFGLRKVRVAASIAEALESIREEGVPDAVVLDLNLPDAEGVEGVLVLRRAARRRAARGDLGRPRAGAGVGGDGGGRERLCRQAPAARQDGRRLQPDLGGRDRAARGLRAGQPGGGRGRGAGARVRLADAAADEHPAADLRGAAEQDHLLRALDRRGDGEDAHRRDHDEDQRAQPDPGGAPRQQGPRLHAAEGAAMSAAKHDRSQVPAAAAGARGGGRRRRPRRSGSSRSWGRRRRRWSSSSPPRARCSRR